ncbi:MAG: gephyrin-like molybdotransferase Glp [Acidimicrobiales bacterium]
MIELEEAREFIFNQCLKLSIDEVDISKSRGLVLADTVISNDDVPPFPNTAMDGYAVRAVDTEHAPVELKVIGTLPAGKVPDLEVGPDEAVRIMTGAVIPEGADAVVMVEKTKEVENGSSVVVEETVKNGNFIRQPGEDFVKGSELFNSGTLIGAAHIGVFATIGLEKVNVFKRPVVGVMSTGDELVQGSSQLKPGQIRDSNRHSIKALLEEIGAEIIDLGLIPDDEKAIESALLSAVEKCDAVVTSGGVSMGDFDYVKVVLDRLGEMKWMQVAIKPAKPLAFGLLNDVPIFGLPGNPVSAMVSFELFMRPALLKMMGYEQIWRPYIKAKATTPLKRRKDGKVHFARVTLTRKEDSYEVSLLEGQGSHQLAAMANAQGLAVLPNGEGLEIGDFVDVMQLTEPELD